MSDTACSEFGRLVCRSVRMFNVFRHDDSPPSDLINKKKLMKCDQDNFVDLTRNNGKESTHSSKWGTPATVLLICPIAAHNHHLGRTPTRPTSHPPPPPPSTESVAGYSVKTGEARCCRWWQGRI